MNIKKALISIVFLAAANMVFAGGSMWAASDRVVYDGESEIFFSYTGPEGVFARVYEDGEFLGSLSNGETERRITDDGSHIIEVHPGVYNEATKKMLKTRNPLVSVLPCGKTETGYKLPFQGQAGKTR